MFHRIGSNKGRTVKSHEQQVVESAPAPPPLRAAAPPGPPDPAPDNVPAPRTLLLTLVFAPDGVSTATILTELASRLRGLGHRLSVHTTTPHYNHDADARRAQPLRPKWGSLLFESDCRGIPVYHARVSAKGKKIFARVMDYLTFHVMSTLSSLVLGGAYDVVLAPSPPLTTGLFAAFLAMLRSAPLIYNVQEIYPDIAVSMGLLRNRLLIRILEGLERFIYRRAHTVVVISDKFRDRLLEKGVPERKIHVIPNFVDVEFIQPAPRGNAFAAEHGLEDRFVVLYAGNIGLTQDFETMLAAAKKLEALKDVCFLVVGDGASPLPLRHRRAGPRRRRADEVGTGRRGEAVRPRPHVGA
jgi:colanic acid biosynthesis glycosyl transferase WcaI